MAGQRLEQSRWASLWNRLGAQGTGLSIFQHLDAAYSEPSRSYHNAEHIRDCLEQFDLARDLATRPDEAETALWFHDAVYTPAAGDNEERSARLAQTALLACAVSLEVAGRIAQMILATRHMTLASAPDAQLVCDVDLSILGREPEAFDEFERRIRKEYGWVPEPLYRASRAQVLSSFLHRRSIYQTEHFRQVYEENARKNLERALATLRS